MKQYYLIGDQHGSQTIVYAKDQKEALEKYLKHYKRGQAETLSIRFISFILIK